MYKLSILMPEILNTNQYHKTVLDKHKNTYQFLTLTAAKRLVPTETFNDEPSPYLKGLGQLKNTRKSQKKFHGNHSKRLPLSGCNDVGGLHSCGDYPPLSRRQQRLLSFCFLLRSAKKAQEHC